MIIRALRLRHGRVALPRSLLSQRRHQSSLETEGESAAAIERSQAPVFLQPAKSTAQAQLDAIPNVRSVHINDPTHPVAQDYAFFQHQKARTHHLGSALGPHYKPYELLSNPPSPKDITLELLLASQAHIGHATSLWHPANARYIFGIRGNKAHGEGPIHIISLEATAAHLRRACRIVSGVTERGGLVLFVGTREGHARPVVKAASMAKGCHLFTKWIPGSITNGQQILGKCAMKVVNEFDQEVEGFEDQLDTKPVLKPDLVVCLNPLENYVLLHECGLNNIPTIGIIDTDANPTWVTYPIPANDDSLRTVQVIAGVLGRAGQEGQEKRLMLARTDKNIITYSETHGLRPPSEPQNKPTRSTARPRRAAPAPEPTPTPTPTPVPVADLHFPDDFEGVEVQQHEEDQQLLEAAEKQLSEQGLGPFNETTETEESEHTAVGTEVEETAHTAAEIDMEASEHTAAEIAVEETEDTAIDVNAKESEPTTSELEVEESEYAAAIPEGAEDDVYSSSSDPIDKSLLDENYGSDHDFDEDLQQFGGIEQLEASESSVAEETQSQDQRESESPVVEETQSQDQRESDESPVEQVAEETPSTEVQDQLEATSASQEPESSAEDHQLEATQAPESPIEQVGEVAEELGEEPSPTTPEPEAESSPEDAAKPEPPVSEDEDGKRR